MTERRLLAVIAALLLALLVVVVVPAPFADYDAGRWIRTWWLPSADWFVWVDPPVPINH